MRSLASFNMSPAKLLCGSALLLILTACGPSQVKDDSNSADAGLSKEDIAQMLTDAEALRGEERVALILQAATAMYASGETDWARNTLTNLNPLALTDPHYFTYTLLTARVLLAEGEYFIAKRHLWENRFQQVLAVAEPGQQIEARELRASLLFDLAEFRQVVDERMRIDVLMEQLTPVPTEERELNQDLIWAALMELPQKDLQLESQMHRDNTARGWFTLAAISKDNQNNLRKQLESVDNWALRWPEHPASLRLPHDLQLLRQLVNDQPRQVAVLLPLTGKLAKASEAIRDGLMAAFYQLSATGENLPELRYYDTNEVDVNTLYDLAVFEGAQLVIGPLDKDKIDELALRPELPVPTLALNYAENAVGDTAQLFQFGLAVEDEARQVAERAWRDGHRRAMILAPESSWGNRSVETFSKTWQELGGELIGDYRYKGQKDYSNLIRDAMDVSDSQQRARRMRQILGANLEFEPRPRKDIDLIFLVAHPAQAKQIKPTLAFHYAGDIPVYATSHIYNGDTDSNANRDMNGIRFATLPWFFNDELPERKAINRFDSESSSYQRLYALGVDAFYLYPRLRQLEEVRKSHYYGNTGTLSLDPQRRIVREQTWAQFIRGRAYAMPTVAYDDDA